VGAITSLGDGEMKLNRTNRLLYARIGKIRTIYLLIRSKSIAESKVLPPKVVCRDCDHTFTCRPVLSELV
jgi:hypothetical protein